MTCLQLEHLVCRYRMPSIALITRYQSKYERQIHNMALMPGKYRQLQHMLVTLRGQRVDAFPEVTVFRFKLHTLNLFGCFPLHETC